MTRMVSGRVRWMATALSMLALAGAAAPVGAARVADIYAESVPVADQSPEATRAAFAEALRRVLVKATGKAAAGQDAAVISGLGDPAGLVQQFRRDAPGSLWARFDAAAVRRGLDAAGLPVWGEDRPLTAIWLAYDTGAGVRDVLAAAGADTDAAAALRNELLRAARARGVPVVLPLRDSQELTAVTHADVWGDFTGPVTQASARYQADAVLIGRARLSPPGMTDVRWTLLVGDERVEWRGGIADGAYGLAERLSQRMVPAQVGAGGGTAHLAVSGITTLDQYGLVLGYLQGLDLVASLSVASIDADTVAFDLRLRGNEAQLSRALAVRRLIEPVAAAGPAVAAPALNYRLVGYFRP